MLSSESQNSRLNIVFKFAVLQLSKYTIFLNQEIKKT
ncbi:hypothetical protein C8P64_2123 [Christiangramia gaetbulicola]|uniref:Uncharacterized protein n=1 Tax=Christiangramia gaetbulicola TaxID=703340 RepID=A0A2T6AIF1_9FLAO|nr:hypothetical protein C8P64_2123 [Christiangramia gaetbulicola]